MNATDILKYGNATFLKSFEGLPEADWNTGRACGYWSVAFALTELTPAVEAKIAALVKKTVS